MGFRDRHCRLPGISLMGKNIYAFGLGPQPGGILHGLVQAVHRVMICQRKGGKSFFYRIVHQFCGGEGSVGTGGVYM